MKNGGSFHCYVSSPEGKTGGFSPKKCARQEEESEEEDPREAIVAEHPLFEGTSEERLGDASGASGNVWLIYG